MVMADGAMGTTASLGTATANDSSAAAPSDTTNVKVTRAAATTKQEVCIDGLTACFQFNPLRRLWVLIRCQQLLRTQATPVVSTSSVNLTPGRIAYFTFGFFSFHNQRFRCFACSLPRRSCFADFVFNTSAVKVWKIPLKFNSECFDAVLMLAQFQVPAHGRVTHA